MCTVKSKLWGSVQGGRENRWPQNGTTVHSCPQLRNANRLSKFFYCTKSVTTASLRIPPHLKRVAALPCEIFGAFSSDSSNFCPPCIKRSSHPATAGTSGIHLPSQPPTCCARTILTLSMYYMGAHSRHLVNTIEPSVCGDDVALCQITLTTWFCVMQPRPKLFLWTDMAL